MKSIENITLNLSSTIKEAMKIIGDGAMKIAIIVDQKGNLCGTISDGDIRRGLLKGLDLNSSIKSIIFRTPTIAKISDTKEKILKLALFNKLYQIPIIDENGKVLGIEVIDELVNAKNKINKVILMVGGLGTRLRPYTENIPKPMLKVGHKPILQTIIERFETYGYKNIIMCANYKSHVIKNYFGDGKEFGVEIEYILEEQRMGTAGALSLLKEKPREPFFVMNGDLLTSLNFEHLHDFHTLNNSVATMCVHRYNFQVPFGVVNIKNSKILSIQEKPTHKFFVNAGIYMLSPEVLEYVPQYQFFDITSFFEKIISKDKNTISFPLGESWQDIGQIQDYEIANNQFDEMF